MPLILDPPRTQHELRRLTPRGERQLSNQSLSDLVNGEGVIPGVELARWPALFAAWTRARMSGDDNVWTPLACDRYQKLLGQILRLTRPDGSLAFNMSEPYGLDASPRARRAAAVEFWKAAAAYASDDQRVVLAALIPETAKNARFAASALKKLAGLPAPAAYSEAAGLAVLRPTWSPREVLAVDYRGRQMRSELTCGGQVVWSGRCNPQISFDGAELVPSSDWEQLCWVSDDDADYLELQLELSGGVRVQRQLLLARQDHFLFTADAVLAERPGRIDYRTTLPLLDGVSFLPAEQTHEGFLATPGGRRPAQVLPLALGEWRSDARGALALGLPCDLELTLTAPAAQALYAPLFIDLSPRRLSRPVTWRQLTVAENRVTQPTDVAVGYRVQAGREQWLFYRSLATCGNRTVLGQNLVSEFLAARFGRSGIADPLMEIEATADDE